LNVDLNTAPLLSHHGSYFAFFVALATPWLLASASATLEADGLSMIFGSG
jgi:hypothetical protein